MISTRDFNLICDCMGEKVAIENVHHEVEGFGHKLKLQMRLDQPIDQNRTHVSVGVLLILHIQGANES